MIIILKKILFNYLKVSDQGRISSIAILLLALLSVSCSTFSPKNKISTTLSSGTRLELDDGKGAYATKKYRNLFNENGHTEQAINHKIKAAFQQLFHGDSATQRIYFPVGRNANGVMAYVLDVYNNDIRSEGMSYGMMISVQINKKEEFYVIW